jgi:hypothetical protein
MLRSSNIHLTSKQKRREKRRERRNISILSYKKTETQLASENSGVKNSCFSIDCIFQQCKGW